MDIITPITITDTILIGSNVPENDAQEYSTTDAYAVGDEVMVATSTANIHKVYENLVAQSAGLTADLLDDQFNSLGNWTDGDTGGSVSEISPAGQLRLDTNTRAAGNYAFRYRTIASPPNTFTIEIKTYFDALGTRADYDYTFIEYQTATWRLDVLFCSNGLYVFKTGGGETEVGADIVKCNATAAWQTWRFQVDKSGGEAAATVEVFLKEEGGEWASQGTVDCDYEVAGKDGLFKIQAYGYATDDIVSHVDYIKIATGLGAIANTSDSPVGNTNWLEVDSTNRWKAFNNVLGSQTEQATKIEYVLYPGETFDSLALLNMASDTVDIVACDTANNLITNGTDWTGATGTTQPTSWDKVGTPADFSIGDAVKITSDANGEGISQTITVSAATEYQLCGLYKNTSGDVAQYAIYDVTHSADIVAATDLPDATDFSSFSKVFNTPAGCTSIKISLLAKTSGDIVWFGSIVCAPTDYSETVTTGTTKPDVVKTDLPGTATSLLTVTINKSTTAKIGELIVGTKISLGTTLASPAPKVSIADYSSQSQDAFGNWTIVQRGYAKKLTCSTKIEATETLTVRRNSDYIFGVLSACRSLMRVWIGDENLSCMIIYGKYDSFELELTCNNFSLLDLDILGMI